MKVSPARLELATFGSGGRRRFSLKSLFCKGLRRHQNGEVLPGVLRELAHIGTKRHPSGSILFGSRGMICLCRQMTL